MHIVYRIGGALVQPLSMATELSLYSCKLWEITVRAKWHVVVWRAGEIDETLAYSTTVCSFFIYFTRFPEHGTRAEMGGPVEQVYDVHTGHIVRSYSYGISKTFHHVAPYVVLCYCFCDGMNKKRSCHGHVMGCQSMTIP